MLPLEVNIEEITFLGLPSCTSVYLTGESLETQVIALGAQVISRPLFINLGISLVIQFQ